MESSSSSPGRKKGVVTIIDRVISFFLTKPSTPIAVEAELEGPPKVAASTPSSSSLPPPPVRDEPSVEAAPEEQPKAAATAITPLSLFLPSIRDDSQTEKVPHKASSQAAASNSPTVEESSAKSSSLTMKDALQYIIQKSFPRSQKVPEEELKSTEYEQQITSSANTSASSSTDSEEVRTLNSSELDDIPVSQLRRKPQQPSKPTSSHKRRRISEPSAPIESRSIGIASRLRPRTSKEAVSTPQRTPVLRSKKCRTASALASAPVQEVPNVNRATRNGDTTGTVAMPVLLPDVDPVLVDKQARES
ncbi:hypothetical protein H6P81_013054 [Aristolochia fimbriata]|uniref:Uncharacterized protein n=1 Tax=Aristolochia fimbriata TaxID=158543 RepID=A0AAV7EGQ5_ARIFI|nr:hypothetical protein H6P81_013054 [Aristolochia fimbriata]